MLVSADIRIDRKDDENISSFFDRISDEITALVIKKAKIRDLKKLHSRYDKDKKLLTLRYLADDKDHVHVQATIHWETKTYSVLEGECECGAKVYERVDGWKKVVCDRCGRPVRVKRKKEIEQRVIVDKLIIERGVWLQCGSCGKYWLYGGFKLKTQCPNCNRVVRVNEDKKPVPLFRLLEEVILDAGKLNVKKESNNGKILGIIQGKGIVFRFEIDRKSPLTSQIAESLADFENYVSSRRFEK